MSSASRTRCSRRGSSHWRVIRTAMAHAPGKVVADLRIARGLDYYTGTVYETQIIGNEDWGSVCPAGGMTPSPPTAAPPIPASESRSACPASSGCSSDRASSRRLARPLRRSSWP